MNFETLCLSLKTDVDRREHMIDVFNQMKIPVKFFDAFTSNDISYENERYFDECDFYQWNIKQKSVMATFISHMKMLEYSADNNLNILIIEDDIEYTNPIDFENVDFNSFDLFNIGVGLSCYSYFTSKEGSKKILKELNSKTITQAYDWELSKLDSINKKTSEIPHFTQVKNKFISNIAPNGYVKY